MDFDLQPDDVEFQAWAAGLVDRLSPLHSARKVEEAGQAFDVDVHRELGQQGALSAGMDGEDLQRVLLFEEFGRVLLFSPALESAAVAQHCDALSSQVRDELLAGTTTACSSLWPYAARAHRDGDRCRIEGLHIQSPWLESADHVLLLVDDDSGGGETGLLVPRSSMTVEASGTLAHRLPCFAARETELSVPVEDVVELSSASVEAVRRSTHLAVAAFAVGAAREALRISAEYAGQRVQFGVPIGSFQAQQHRLADVELEVFAAELLTRSAAISRSAQAPQLAALALRRASSAFMQAAWSGSLVHGGYGFTKEFDIQLFLRTARVVEALYKPSVERSHEAVTGLAAIELAHPVLE